MSAISLGFRTFKSVFNVTSHSEKLVFWPARYTSITVASFLWALQLLWFQKENNNNDISRIPQLFFLFMEIISFTQTHSQQQEEASVKHRLSSLHSELQKCRGLTRLRSRSLFRTLPFVFSQKPTPLVWRVHLFNYPWFCEAKTTWSQLLKGLFFNTPLSVPGVHKLLLFQFDSGQTQWRGMNFQHLVMIPKLPEHMRTCERVLVSRLVLRPTQPACDQHVGKSSGQSFLQHRKSALTG